MVTRTRPEFWTRVQKTETCWLWTGHVDQGGYGKYSQTSAHRVAYRLLRGPIPSGLEIDHLCCVTACVNPDHLEVVTPAENMRRRSERLTTCKNGHPRTEDNIYRWRGHGHCRACNREVKRRGRIKSEQP